MFALLNSEPKFVSPNAALPEWPVGRALLLASQSRAQIVKTLPWTGNRQWADALTQAKAKAREEQRKAT